MMKYLHYSPYSHTGYRLSWIKRPTIIFTFKRRVPRLAEKFKCRRDLLLRIPESVAITLCRRASLWTSSECIQHEDIREFFKGIIS